ncbi:DNA adenine methylase [Alcanivorax sp.]|uniref:DNA adenine methylase n=1 Tax=Alcanivorax sp. TaxID=1872427 RepID=UPI002589E045|nr:DNA adenine methylase [Alcanivorax sp.]
MQISPLRYPGGKGRWTNFIGKTIEENGLIEGLYVEPFAGGACVALNMARLWYAKRIWINDLDKAVYAFWTAVFNDSERLCNFVEKVPLSIDEWLNQKMIYESETYPSFDLACAFLYLNRTNHSGIINAKPIGGMEQNGKWKIDARFNREGIIKKIRKSAKISKRVRLTCMDGCDVIREASHEKKVFIFADPPYFEKGSRLYLNPEGTDLHNRVKESLHEANCDWVLSYDNCEQAKKLFGEFKHSLVPVWYSARKKRYDKELLFAAKYTKIPEF